MLGTLLILSLTIASVRVWIAVIRRWRNGQPALEPATRCRSPWLPLASLIAGAYIFLWGFAGSGPQESVDLTVVQQSVALGAVEIVVAIALLTGGFRARPEEVGLRADRLDRQSHVGLLAFLASFGPVMLVLLATSWVRSEETLHPYLRLLRDEPSPSTFAWILLGAVGVAPVREELLFRVMLQDGLARRIGGPAAIGIVAVLFSAVHGFPDSLALVPLALILGYEYQQRQSLISVVTTHALFNLTNLAILLLNPDAP